MAREARPPVIAVMGHIDHGKSSLLDYIRKANVVAGEAGGITQHVAAYVAMHNDRPVTFLDTPGHEAFKTLRARGAAAADIAILVVAADEGVMPQTLDALSAIKEAEIPYLVAITKIDKSNADIERAKTSLLEHEVLLEGLGGDVAYAPISSKSGEGVPELLDLVVLAADLAELTADPEARATGFVLESTQDPKRGASATLVVKDGSLTTGGFAVAGEAIAPIRFIENFLGERVERIGPSEPARISGFSSLPSAGAIFSIVDTKKDAEKCAKEQCAGQMSTAPVEVVDGVTELPLVIKADTQGSIDAIAHELNKINVERGVLRVVATGVGSVSEGDIKTAHAAQGIIVAFNVGTDAIARDLADREQVEILSFSIIYELAEAAAAALATRVPKIATEVELGRATVLKSFSSSAKKQVVGMRWASGVLARKARIKIMKGDEEVARGSILNLQQARADVSEIKVEGDFGAELEVREPLVYGDQVVAFSVTEA